jgi:hypothetical protein
MASALSDLLQLELAAAPLDEVLAEMGVGDEMVETTAGLIELLGRSNYAGGLREEDVGEAERLRKQLSEELDELLGEIQKEQEDD